MGHLDIFLNPPPNIVWEYAVKCHNYIFLFSNENPIEQCLFISLHCTLSLPGKVVSSLRRSGMEPETLYFKQTWTKKFILTSPFKSSDE